MNCEMSSGVKTHFVFGGARSGKTDFAMKAAVASGCEKWMIATAVAEDDEMAARIARHRAARGEDWRVIEESLDLAKALRDNARDGRVIVVDCLTLWLSNLFFQQRDIAGAIEALAEALATSQGQMILVSNELGHGLAPETALGRNFRDEHGLMNQAIAAACSRVTFVVAGLPMVLKGESKDALAGN